MTATKKWIRQRYDYDLRDVKRKCGHTDDLVTVRQVLNASEPSVREGQEKMPCYACHLANLTASESRRSWAETYGRVWCEDHGVEASSIVSQNGGEKVEIIIWLDVPQEPTDA